MCTGLRILTVYIHPDRDTHRHILTPTHQWAGAHISLPTSLYTACFCVRLCSSTSSFSTKKTHQTLFFIRQQEASLNNLWLAFSQSFFLLSLAASLPVRRTEETAGARHRPHHPTSEQLVSRRRVYMQSISGVCNPRLSKSLMIGINASTPPLVSPYTHTQTHARTTYRTILT